MLLQINIFALILVTYGANQEGLKCNLKWKRHFECVLPTFTNSTKHTVTANFIVPAVVKTTPTMSLQPANNTTPGSRVGLQLWQEIVVGISSSIALLVIIVIVWVGMLFAVTDGRKSPKSIWMSQILA